MRVERKDEVEMVCYFSDLSWLMSQGRFDTREVQVWPRDKFTKSPLQEQYLDLREVCFPVAADDEQFDAKDDKIEWIGFCQRDGLLVSCAEVICNFDVKRCTLENVMTHPDWRGRHFAQHVSAALLLYMYQGEQYETASLSCLAEHAPIYEALDFQLILPKRAKQIALAG